MPANASALVPNSANSGTAGSGDIYVTAACTVKSLLVRALVAGTGSTDTSTVIVRHNDAVTSMGCTVASPNTLGAINTCTDTTHTFTVAAADVVEYRYSQSNGTPTIVVSTLLVCN